MKYIAATLIFIVALNVGLAQPYKRVHRKSVVADAHNDFLTESVTKQVSFEQDLKGITHSDLKRMKEGGIDVQIFSIWCDGRQTAPFAYANRQIDTLYAVALRNPRKISIVKTPGELKRAVRQGKLGAMIGVEGGHMIENDLRKLDSLFNRGARYLTLTWNNSNPWASSAMEESSDTLLHQPKGLSVFGRQVVERMNELGMMVDLSHVGEQTFWDAINVTSKPVILSHSDCHQLCPVFRNLTDEQVKAVGKNGGVINVNFFSGFLDSNFNKHQRAFIQKHRTEFDSLKKINPQPVFAFKFLDEKYPSELEQMRPPLSLLLDHIDHIVNLIGVDHVGMGSDFDGISSTPQQLDDVTGYPLITKGLLARGYSKKEVRKILGGNFIRLFSDNSTKK
jgi:membrane dipeptidase